MKILIKLFLFVCLFFCLTTASAVEPEYKKYKWESNPKIHAITPEEEKDNNYIVLKNKILLEFAYETSGQLVLYETIHTIIHFNNEKGIEEMNKVYIASSRILEEMDLKARTITHDGKIIMLSSDAVKKVDNLENSGPYIIFAMEGVDKGGEIEYLYTNKKSTNLYGSWTLQHGNIRKNINIDIYSPSNLIFEGKGYNGFPGFTTDTTLEDKRHIHAYVDYVSVLNDEKYSAYDANKMYFDYQLTYNLSKGKSRLYSWDYTAARFYPGLFEFSKSETKAVEKLISKLDLKKMASDEARIEALERYMKFNITFQGGGGDFTVDKVLDLKYGDELNIQKVYIGVAQMLNIPIEIALTTDRFDRKFDGSFQTWNSLEDYLIYYPSLNKYLSAKAFSSRLGFPPPGNTFNKALFIKESVIGDLKTGVAKIKNIEPRACEDSYNNITAKVVFNDDLTPIIDFKQEFVGYSAYYVQPTVSFLDETQKKELIDELSKLIGKEVTVTSANIYNYAQEEVYKKPFIVESKLEAAHLIENAGNKYLFKLGALIGPQEELYQETKRQTDGEIQYNHSFTRILEVKIPDGYKIVNPETILMDKKFESDGKVLCSFKSTYTIEQGVLKVKVYEDYKTLLYPKEKFEEFRTVINAAADFNKIVLILEK